MKPAEGDIFIDKLYTICECLFSSVKSVCYKVKDDAGTYYILKELFPIETEMFSAGRNKFNCPAVAEEFNSFINTSYTEDLAHNEADLFTEFYADDNAQNNEPYAFNATYLNVQKNNNTKARYILIDTVRGCDMKAYRSKIIEDDDFLEKTIEIMISACSSLEAVHNRKMLHLDIKPGNLYVVDLVEHPFVKTIDLGSSIHLGEDISDAELKQMGKMTSSKGYSSPKLKEIDSLRIRDVNIEEIRTLAGKLDARDDIFSLIMTFVYMLLGKTCVDTDEFYQIYAKQKSGPAYSSFILEILQKGFRGEYASIEAVKHDFKQLLNIIKGKGYHPEILKKMAGNKICNDSTDINNNLIDKLHIIEL